MMRVEDGKPVNLASGMMSSYASWNLLKWLLIDS
jgi:hypothetical protein